MKLSYCFYSLQSVLFSKFKFLVSLNQSKFLRLSSRSGFAGFHLNQKYGERLLAKYSNLSRNLVYNSHFTVVLNKNINLLYNAAFACLIHKTNTNGSFAKHCKKKFYGPRLHLSVHLLREFYDGSFTNIPWILLQWLTVFIRHFEIQLSSNCKKNKLKSQYMLLVHQYRFICCKKFSNRTVLSCRIQVA